MIENYIDVLGRKNIKEIILYEFFKKIRIRYLKKTEHP